MMKTSFMKLACTLLALLMLATAFAACRKKPVVVDPVDTTTNAAETIPLPHYDWKGRSFSVLGAHNPNEPNFEIMGSQTGSIVEQQAYSRNNWLENYFNVEIVELGDESDKPLELIQQAISSGDHTYNLAFLIRGDMSSAVVNGYMKDMTELPYLDLANEWYNSFTIDSIMIQGRLFHMVSDFSLVDKARTNVLFYNRDLGAQYQFPDIVQMVRDGEWTVEEMAKWAKNYNLDGEEGFSLNDLWGLTCGGKEASAAFWNGCGNKVVSFDDEGNWSVTVANEHSVSSIDKLRGLFNGEVSFVGNKMGSYDDPWNSFTGSKAFFCSATLGGIESLASTVTFAYTALPYPKFDADQTGYYTTNDNTYCATFGIPQCAAEPDFSAFMVEALSWKSHTTTYPTYMETICKVRGSYDPICYEMLELTLDGLTFDFGLMYSLGLRTNILLKSILENGEITSLYAEVKTATEGDANTPGKLPTMLDTIATLDS